MHTTYKLTARYGTFEIVRTIPACCEEEALRRTGLADLKVLGWTIIVKVTGREV